MDGGGDCPGLEELDAYECPKGRSYRLSPENEEFWELIQLALPGMVREQGFDYTSLKTVFDIHGLPAYKQKYYLEKAVCIMAILQEKRREDSGKRH